MKNCLLTLFLLLFTVISFAQTLPADRAVDWTLAGLRDTTTAGFVTVDMQAAGAVGDGVTSNSTLIHTLIEGSAGQGIILDFPAGNFLFDTTINIRTNNVIIRGAGQENTTFLLDMSGLWFKNSEGIRITGNLIRGRQYLSQPAFKDSSYAVVPDASIYSPDDWVKMIINDSIYIFSEWALETVGQIVQIQSIVGNQLYFKSPLRMNFLLAENPFISRLNMRENVGIECLKIKRIDNTSPRQSNTIEFWHAANCWVSGIESDTTNFSHIIMLRSTNIYVGNSYFHHAFEYGSGGRAYGVNLALTTGECLIENNVFKRLRHSMLVQAGANGNVFAFNFSTDPYWTNTDPIIPADAAGDMVLHGNWPYANLFEQNLGQSMVIDNSHAANGPHNTFLRNRAEKFGIFFNDATSPSQNFIGNDITNTTFPYSTFNYLITGADHFVHGNNNKGTVDPPGTTTLPDLSYYYTQRPDFIPVNQWGAIGTPNPPINPGNQAFDRFASGNVFAGSCGNPLTSNEQTRSTDHLISVFPNPSHQLFQIESEIEMTEVAIYNLTGQLIKSFQVNDYTFEINAADLSSGIYMLKIIDKDQYYYTKKIIKSK